MTMSLLAPRAEPPSFGSQPFFGCFPVYLEMLISIGIKFQAKVHTKRFVRMSSVRTPNPNAVK
jgi:hypothetical protein